MDLKRRHFLAAGASAVATAGLSGAARAQVAAKTDDRRAIGDFLLARVGRGLRVSHRREPDRVLWQTASNGDFLAAETAIATIKEYGAPEGSFSVSDAVKATFGKPSIDSFAVDGAKATVTGNLTGPGGAVGYALTFEAVSTSHLRFEIKAAGPKAAAINRIRLRIASEPDEAIFGLGVQLTYFDLKGHAVPIIVQEHGVGRGRPFITELVNVFDHQSGGTPYDSGAPAPYFLTSRRRALFLENAEYSVFDLRRADRIDIKLWSATMTGRILYGATPLDLVEAYTEYSGRMRALPDWVHEGAILGLMGGTAVVNQRVGRARKAGMAIAGLWLQDWVGVRKTSVGTQLWWNWELDQTYYPNWRELVADIEHHGGRVLGYTNPFLATDKGHDDLFVEARAKGYLVAKPDGSPYLIRNSSFRVGMLDLANPDARAWIKGVIKTNMIEGAALGGWMLDFAEALPFDAKLYGGADPAVWHNTYPEEWQRISREAIEETGKGDQMVFFARSGFTRSPGIATLFWLGDQLMTWDAYDGIKTAVVGLLSSGVSGFSLMHSDVGGYDVIKLDALGKAIPFINRTPELEKRWMELNAFTAVLRTMEGLAPDLSPQFDSTPDALAHSAFFSKVYKGLAPYRKRLVAEAAARGYPVVRPLFLHYPDDPNAYELKYQFLLGPDVLVAPVLDKGADSVDVYFPAGDEWTDLWTGAAAGGVGDWATMPAPIGKPAVFLKKGGASRAEIVAGLKSAGVLSASAQ
jgi:alpha-glucosidase